MSTPANISFEFAQGRIDFELDKPCPHAEGTDHSHDWWLGWQAAAGEYLEKALTDGFKPYEHRP